MSEADYYPPGAYNDPNAPYNQCDPEEIEKEISISISLSKSTKVLLDDYTAEEWEDSEIDEDGYVVGTCGVDYDFSKCDLQKAYSDSEYSIEELLEILKEVATEKVATIAKKYQDPNRKGVYNFCSGNEARQASKDFSKFRKVLRSLEDWTVDEQEIILED